MNSKMASNEFNIDLAEDYLEHIIDQFRANDGQPIELPDHVISVERAVARVGCRMQAIALWTRAFLSRASCARATGC